MPANLKEPFAESCCDGGAYPGEGSALRCGCDPAIHYTCSEHRVDEICIVMGYCKQHETDQPHLANGMLKTVTCP